MKKEIFIVNTMKKFQKPFFLCVNGNSMFPTLKNGDRIMIIPCKERGVKVDDIIVYNKLQDHLTVHRIFNIVKLNEKRFYCETKGDNNDFIDPYKVFDHEIIGIIDLERAEYEYD